MHIIAYTLSKYLKLGKYVRVGRVLGRGRRASSSLVFFYLAIASRISPVVKSSGSTTCLLLSPFG